MRLAGTDNLGPLRAGVDDIRLEAIGSAADARIELPVTPEPARAVDLALHRMHEADALKALAARADKLAAEDEFSGAVLIAKNGRGSSAAPTAWPSATGRSGTPSGRVFASGR